MKKIVLKFVLFLAIIFILDRAIGAGLAYFFNKTIEGDSGGRINLALRQSPEIVILGNSRAEHNYIPRLFETITGFSTFNAGMDGQSIFYHFGMQQLLCEKHVPRIIILDFWPSDLLINDHRIALERLTMLSPYWENARILQLLNLRGPFERIKFLSKIYPFNSRILGILKFILNRTAEGSSARNGYSPLRGSISEKLIASANEKFLARVKMKTAFDPLKIRILRQIIEAAKKSKIKLFFVESPFWYPDRFRKPMGDIRKKDWAELKMLIDLDEVELIRDFSGKGPFQDRVIFKDFVHMNDAGARIFSKIVAKRIADSLGKLL